MKKIPLTEQCCAVCIFWGPLSPVKGRCGKLAKITFSCAWCVKYRQSRGLK